ncbi:MAG: TlpA family protein disulfide reductase [Pseudomonadales bacterium]|nr:TlpA family protein disulfide reductase [Pseudomonadales bacterium]
MRHAPVLTLAVGLLCGALAASAGAAGPSPQAASKPAQDVADKTAISPAAIAAAPATPDQFRQLLTQQRGSVVILNVWGTWCVPCLREIPELVKLQRDLADKGVALIGLSMDEASSIGPMVEPFRQKYFPAFRTYVRNSPDMDSMVSVVDSAWNEILPTTYILDRQGRVARKIQGVKTYDEFRTMVLAVAEPAGAS